MGADQEKGSFEIRYLCIERHQSLGVYLDSILGILAQYLVPEEQLLFSTEKVEIKPHLSQAQRLAGGRVSQTRPPITGAMAITDRRIFVVAMEGVFSKKPALKFEAIYDSGYAEQLIETTKAKNEEITQQSQGMGMFARAKFMKEQGFRGDLKILTAANLQKGLIGGENLVLQIFTVHMSSLGQKGKNIARKIGKIVSYGTFDLDKIQFELRIKRPLSLSTKAVMAGSLLTGNVIMYGILKAYEGKTNVTYGPLLDIMQAKAQEIAGLVKDFEAAAA